VTYRAIVVSESRKGGAQFPVGIYRYKNLMRKGIVIGWVVVNSSIYRRVVRHCKGHRKSN